MHQSTFFDLASEHKKKVTRQQRFLNEMDAVLPWLLFKSIRKRRPRAGRGININNLDNYYPATPSTRGSGYIVLVYWHSANSGAIHARVGVLNKRKNLLKLLKRFGTTSSRD